MKLILRLLENQRCAGCGGMRHVEEKTGFCLYCYALALELEEKRRKLKQTARQRFVAVVAQARREGLLRA